MRTSEESGATGIKQQSQAISKKNQEVRNIIG
jgi:hypothetical protein